MLRNTLQVIASAVLWIVFVLYWRIVLRRPMNPDTRTALIILSVLTVLTVAYILVWVYHNIRIYRTLDRRKERRRVERTAERDYLGRFLVFEGGDALERSSYIDVEVKPGYVGGRPVERKIFKTRVTRKVSF